MALELNVTLRGGGTEGRLIFKSFLSVNSALSSSEFLQSNEGVLNGFLLGFKPHFIGGFLAIWIARCCLRCCSLLLNPLSLSDDPVSVSVSEPSTSSERCVYDESENDLVSIFHS
jgi:hypothetical protein